jgi:predicted small lipoprotein YifL
MRRALILLTVLAACGDDGGIALPDSAPAADASPIDAAPPRELIMTQQPLQVGELVEAIMHGGPGDSALIHLSGPAMSVSWNLHSHQSGGTQVIYEQLKQTTVDYEFKPASTADWYLLIRNDGLTDINVDVKVGLYGAITWTWQ